MVCEDGKESKFEAQLEVNGKEIELNNFVTDFVAETVIGMIQPLRGVNGVDSVKLSVKRK